MSFWYDGQLVEEDRVGTASAASLPLDNVGLRFGATVFTTMRVYGDNLQHPLTQWQAHCDRLTRSIQAFDWTPPSWLSIYKGCEQLKTEYPILRITLFPDGREWITGRSSHVTTADRNGITCWVAPPVYARSLPMHKTGNYLACWLAKTQAQKVGAQEAILTSDQGEWLETSTGNLWGWKRSNGEGSWHTPIHNRCLPGIMRNTLKKILEKTGQPVHLESWSSHRLVSLLPDFEAMAYSNCVIGLAPIHTILNGATTLEYNPEHASIKALQRQLTQLASH